MSYAGKKSDLPPEERYDMHRLKSLVNQTTGNMPHIQEIFNGLLYHIEQFESRMIASYDPDAKPYDPAGLKDFFNGYDKDLSNKEKER